MRRMRSTRWISLAIGAAVVASLTAVGAVGPHGAVGVTAVAVAAADESPSTDRSPTDVDEPEFAVSGTVTDTLTGAPIPGTSVLLFGVTPGVGASPFTSATTDATGVYSVTASRLPDAIGVPNAVGYENEYRYPQLSGDGPFVIDLDVYPTSGDPAVSGRLVNARTGEAIRTGQIDVFLHYTSFVDGTRPFLPFSVGYAGQIDRLPADPTWTFEFYRVAPSQEFHVEGWAPGFGYGDGDRGVRSDLATYDGTTPVELTIELEPHFTDVEVPTEPSDTSDFEVAIGWFGDRELADGFPDGSFRPWTTVTRQALAAFLYRLEGSPEQALTDAFDDVSADHPFAREIAWMAASGLSTGYDDDTFRPTQPVTRQAMAAFLYRFADGEVPADHDGFPDVGDDHPFAAAIAWMEGNAITTGYDDGSFRPNATLRRGPTAQFLYRLDGLLMAGPG